MERQKWLPGNPTPLQMQKHLVSQGLLLAVNMFSVTEQKDLNSGDVTITAAAEIYTFALTLSSVELISMYGIVFILYIIWSVKITLTITTSPPFCPEHKHCFKVRQ